MSDDKKVIFSMSGVTKTYQGANTPVLKNIYLSFFYGAKIGILGLNGSGKSTLLKIIAGREKNYQGDVVFSPGYSVGMLEQEPELDEAKTVLEVVKEGVAETVAILDEYNKINDQFGLGLKFETALVGGAAIDVFPREPKSNDDRFESDPVHAAALGVVVGRLPSRERRVGDEDRLAGRAVRVRAGGDGRPAGVGRPEQGDDGRCERGGDVPRTRVVGDQQ